ncbi:MAG: hypothetical protein KDK54_05265 [Leptospiraceae bacterium]|nr:hypothetical protein [Leptospiraceae bacterium]
MIIGGLVLLVVIAIFFLTKDKDKSGGSKKDGMMSSTKDPTKSSDSDFRDGTRKSADGNEDGPITEDGVTPEYLLDEYLEWAQYPPYSRPLSNYNYDLTEPFFVQESPLVMVDKPEDKEGNGYKCHLQPKEWAAIGLNSEMFITLECRDKDNQVIPVKVDEARVFREFDGQRFSSVKPDYNDDGRDGDEVSKDNIITFKWRGMKVDWGQMMLEADIEYGDKKKSTVKASFFSSPGKPAEIGNVFREVIQDGSLVVYATVQVYTPGKYHIEANLKESQEGNYISYAVFDGSLKAGTQEVELIFFGKILKDKGYDGPYILTDVRGHRVNLPIDPDWFNQGEEGLKKIQAAKSTEPDKELVTPFREEYKTKNYNLSQFSNQVYSSQDKENRIRELQALAKKE